MRLIEFPEQTKIIAENQDEYISMPVHHVLNDDGGETGHLICCWKLSFLERIKILFCGKVWHQMLTFGEPIQPQKLTIEKPLMKKNKHV